MVSGESTLFVDSLPQAELVEACLTLFLTQNSQTTQISAYIVILFKTHRNIVTHLISVFIDDIDISQFS